MVMVVVMVLTMLVALPMIVVFVTVPMLRRRDVVSAVSLAAQCEQKRTAQDD